MHDKEAQGDFVMNSIAVNLEFKEVVRNQLNDMAT
jgi:hypothetical protein